MSQQSSENGAVLLKNELFTRRLFRLVGARLPSSLSSPASLSLSWRRSLVNGTHTPISHSITTPLSSLSALAVLLSDARSLAFSFNWRLAMTVTTEARTYIPPLNVDKGWLLDSYECAVPKVLW